MLFSVIVANYNNGKYLDDLIKSILNQTYPDWELVIADDASTDHSEEVVSRYKPHNRIKFIRHKVNAGAGAAFKTAADNSTGDIIGMLGADDALMPNALEIMIHAHQKNAEAAMITTRAYDCDDKLQPFGICKISGEQPVGVPLIKEIHICNFVTFKRSYYKKTDGFEAVYKRAVDIDIYLKMEESGGEISFVDDPLYLYRRHATGISQGGNGSRAYAYSLLAHSQAYRRRKKNAFEPNLSEKEHKNILFQYYQRSAYFSRVDKKFSESVLFLLKCVDVKFFYIFNKSFWAGLYYNLIKSNK